MKRNSAGAHVDVISMVMMSGLANTCLRQLRLLKRKLDEMLDNPSSSYLSQLELIRTQFADDSGCRDDDNDDDMCVKLSHNTATVRKYIAAPHRVQTHNRPT